MEKKTLKLKENISWPKLDSLGFTKKIDQDGYKTHCLIINTDDKDIFQTVVVYDKTRNVEMYNTVTKRSKSKYSTPIMIGALADLIRKDLFEYVERREIKKLKTTKEFSTDKLLEFGFREYGNKEKYGYCLDPLNESYFTTLVFNTYDKSFETRIDYRDKYGVHLVQEPNAVKVIPIILEMIEKGWVKYVVTEEAYKNINLYDGEITWTKADQ